MSSPPTLAGALVRSLRAHGARPAGAAPGSSTWSEVVDRSRLLGLGLADAGWSGRAIAVEASGRPARDLGGELAVLCAGSVLALPGAEANAVVVGEALRSGDGTTTRLVDLVAAGARLDRRDPAAAERHLAAIDPDAPAVADRRRTLTHGEALWGVRAVDRWLTPAVGADAPGLVLAVPGDDAPALTAALVGRWWPATVGAGLAPAPDPGDEPSTAGRTLVVLSATGWAEVARRLRHQAGRRRRGRSLLRRGRLVVAGEADGPQDRARLALARRRAGEAIRERTGLGDLRLGLCLAPLDPGTARDLEALDVPVAVVWCEQGVAGAVAAGPVARTATTEGWGRALPGRRIEAEGHSTVVFGGDVADEGLRLDVATRIDDRGRVALPRPARRPFASSEVPR